MVGQTGWGLALVGLTTLLLVGNGAVRKPVLADAGAVYDVGVIAQEAYVQGVNDAGQVVGYSTTRHAFGWRAGDLVFLPEKGGDTESITRGLNADGIVVGSARGGRHDRSRPVVWKKGKLRNLRLLPGTLQGKAEAINDRGDVVGWCSRDSVLRPTVWIGGSPRKLKVPADLVHGSASDINNARQIVGSIATVSSESQSLPCLWEGKHLTVLALPIGYLSGVAIEINNSGRIVGHVGAGGNVRVACVWDNGIPTVLGTLGGESSNALSVNEAGWVAGTAAMPGTNSPHPFLWKGADLIDLTDLVPHQFAGLIEEAKSISDNGMIVVNGISPNSDSACYLLQSKEQLRSRERNSPSLALDNPSDTSRGDAKGTRSAREFKETH